MPPRKPAKPRTLSSVSAKNAAKLMEEQNQLAMEALKLRRGGLDWWDIAERLRVTPKVAKEAVASGIKAAAELVDTASKAELLQMEVLRIDSLQQANWQAAMNGDVRAGAFILSLIKERVSMLGLDSQEVNTLTVNTVVVPGASEEYIAALRAIQQAGDKVDVVPGEVTGEGA